MTPFKPASLAAASALLVAVAAGAARPHYGGTLRVEMPGAIRALDPSLIPAAPGDAITARALLPLVFETLTTIDPDRGWRPLLAASMQQERAAQWRVVLRTDVRLHDGSMLQPSQVTASLRARHAEWQIAVDGGAIVIEAGPEDADVPWALADTQSAIAVAGPAGALLGTGPFRLDRVAADALTLQAHDVYWGGRPFLDSLDIRLGRPLADQRADLEAGRADVVTVQPTDARGLSQRQFRIARSQTRDLIAMTFEPHLVTPEDGSLRRTVASSIDRSSMARVVLQGDGEPADALLPSRTSGYAPFVLARTNPPLSRSAVAALRPARRALAIRVDAGDVMMQAIAQRIAVNARDAGFVVTVQTQTGVGPRPDLRMIRLPLEASTPGRALDALMTAIGPRTMQLIGRMPPPSPNAGIDEVARIERALLERDVIVPIAYVPEMYGLTPRVQLWTDALSLPSGALNLADAWLDADPLTP